MKRAPRLPALALLDWGIGGLGVRVALSRLCPDLGVTYVSDTGAAPYGTLSPEVLHRRLAQVIEALRARGVERVFLACNAASTVLAQGARLALPADGMIGAGVDAVLATPARHVGVVGGVRTVTSRVYRQALARHGLRVSQRIAQPLSAAIEAGRARAEDTAALVGRIVAPLRRVDALLLACTHYPCATEAFVRALPSVRLIDPAPQAAKRIADACPRGGATRDVVLTTGDAAAMRRSAKAAFDVVLGDIEPLYLG
jgi:glutamate racemase